VKAIILAGGKGTRLKPFTSVIPKPLVPVGDRTILEILIGGLKKDRITDLVLCVNHMSGLIKAYFGDGAQWGVNIEYSVEEGFLSTVAPIKLVKNLPDDFLVMNGDLLTDLDFRDLYDYHLQNRALLTIATYKRTSQIDFGVIDIDEDRQTVVGFREKPVQELNVSMGAYAFNKRLLCYVPDNKPFGFDELVLTLLREKRAVNVYPFSGYWLDIGRPADYDKANQDAGMILRAIKETRTQSRPSLRPAKELAVDGAAIQHGYSGIQA
jgi:NDP-sugar pyrophosphorylase family protein